MYPASAEAPCLSAAPHARLREAHCSPSPGVAARASWRSGSWQAAGRQSVQIGEAPAQWGARGRYLARITLTPLRAGASVPNSWRSGAARQHGGAAARRRGGAVRRGAAARLLWEAPQLGRREH
jgi:hypothetical protein